MKTRDYVRATREQFIAAREITRMGVRRRNAEPVVICFVLRLTREPFGVSPAERNMRFAVDQFAEGLQTNATNPPAAAGLPLYYWAKSLAKLLETARRELDSDREAAMASLVTASHILQAEIDRCSGAHGFTRGGLAAWQILRVRAFIDSNLHRAIHIRDLSAVARRSPAHFSRKFKLAVGESPHAYVVSRRLERACHLMMTSAASLSEIALSVGFSDQAHLCRLFRQAFGQSPANWRREREIPGEATARTSMDENIP
jgi:AraC family transcriptional regulator